MKLTSLNNLPEKEVSHNQAIKKKVMLSPGDLPHLTNFSQARLAPGQISPGHFHRDMCEVFYVESGSGIIVIDGKEYPLEKGTCVATETGEVHEIINNGSTDLVINYFGLQV